ncbi:uncharacterized protein FFUJ_14817 [Fusarium fujikuroi IMI 58289]|nr:uncharacterized protein FFUJ_14817 [Fusarium fujikuroi IMI 58289]
MLLGSIV